MRILHIIESLDNGGAERVLLNIIKFNPNKKIHHGVLCLAIEGPMADEFRKNDIEVMALNKKKGADITLLFRANKVLKTWHPDLLHSHLFTGNLWGRLLAMFCDIPCVMSVQNADTWIRGWRRWVERLLVGVPKITIGASVSALDCRVQFGMLKEASVIIPNGVSVKANETESVSQRQETRQSWGANDKSFVVGVLARCVPQKNPTLFLEVAEKMVEKNKDVVFVWTGGGSSYELFSQKIKHPRILFEGHKNNTIEVVDAYDAMISTSIREGFSLSLIEGMMMGLPILATAVPGNIEMFETLNKKLLSQKNTVNWFVENLQNWIENKELAKQIGQELKEKVVELYSADKMASAYCHRYEALGL